MFFELMSDVEVKFEDRGVGGGAGGKARRKMAKTVAKKNF